MSVHPEGMFAFAPDTNSATFNVFPLDASGQLRKECHSVRQAGLGVHTITRERPKPRVQAPPKAKEKEKRRILEGIQPMPALEPNKA